MMHFIDVGANEGQTFDYLHEHPEYDGCTVWCFEPSPRSLEGLMRRASMEHGRYNVHVCPFGVRGSSGITPFFLMETGSQADSFHKDVGPAIERAYSLDIYSVSIVNWLIENVSNLDVAFLKLDCEGSEYEILWKLLGNDSAFCRVQRILVEFHPIANPVTDADELVARYRAKGKPLEEWLR